LPGAVVGPDTAEGAAVGAIEGAGEVMQPARSNRRIQMVIRCIYLLYQSDDPRIIMILG
jgi:hypothetical protein